jgi:hypothetical protein
MQVALRERNLDPGFAQFFFDREIEIALEAAGPMAHLAAPDYQFEVDRALAELFQEYTRRRIFQDVGITPSSGNSSIAHFVDIASVSHADRHPETHSRIAKGPVRHWRVDEFRVRHDHRDVVVGQNHGAARADLLHLTGDTGYFHAVADRDGPFRKDHQAADKVARNILEAEADADADRAREHGQRAEMDSGVLENNEDADDEDEVADDLGDRVLEGTVEAALNEEPVE